MQRSSSIPPTVAVICTDRLLKGQKKDRAMLENHSYLFYTMIPVFSHGNCTLKPAPSIKPMFWQGIKDPGINVYIHTTGIALQLQSKTRTESSNGKWRVRLKIKT